MLKKSMKTVNTNTFLWILPVLGLFDLIYPDNQFLVATYTFIHYQWL